VGRSSQRKRSRQRSNARRRQPSNARARTVAKPPVSTGTSGYASSIEKTMFFMRLRRGARWAFILLIIVFAFTFLFAGVGSGSGSDVIQSLLGMRGGNPVKSAEKEVAKHPNNASALIRLAQAYSGKQLRGDAINTYKEYLNKRPKDLSALSALSTLQQEVLDLRGARYQALQSALASVYGPLSSDPLQTLTGTDTLISAYSSLMNTKLNNAYASYTTAAKALEDTYKSYAKAVLSGGRRSRSCWAKQLVARVTTRPRSSPTRPSCA
jgi:hypothetical protein